MRTSRSKGSFVFNSIVFFVLIIQTTATVIVTRYTRIPSKSNSNNNEPLYSTLVAVTLQEFLKMWVGIIGAYYDASCVNPTHSPLTSLYNQLIGSNTQKFFLMAVPAFVYSVQNNLLILALHHLDSAIYQIVYQLKIFTSAIFGMLLLSKSYNKLQWLSFAFLACGAIVAKLSSIELS